MFIFHRFNFLKFRLLIIRNYSFRFFFLFFFVFFQIRSLSLDHWRLDALQHLLLTGNTKVNEIYLSNLIPGMNLLFFLSFNKYKGENDVLIF